MKYDPINDITSFVGEEADRHFYCNENGALGRDGYIYTLSEGNRVLKIDTVNNSHCVVGDWNPFCTCWGDAILRIDGCIYWPPCNAGHVL